jgi:hypothetical protein
LYSVAALLLCCYWEPGGYQLALAGSAKCCSCSQKPVQDHGGCFLPGCCKRVVDKVQVGDAWVSGLVRIGYEGHLGIWRSLHQVCLEDAQRFAWVVLYCYSHKTYDI